MRVHVVCFMWHFVNNTLRRQFRQSPQISTVLCDLQSYMYHYKFQCCEMLDSLGIPYVQSPGEAEATCAALNASGVMTMLILHVQNLNIL